MEKQRKGPKRLIVDINEEEHAEIKSRAAKRHIPMRVWVHRALIEAIKKEQIYDNTNNKE